MTTSRRSFDRIAFVTSPRPEAREAMMRLRHIYGSVPETEADVIVALGGDGLMLDTLRRHMNDSVPVFGLNQGTIGFLMNDHGEIDLPARMGFLLECILLKIDSSYSFFSTITIWSLRNFLSSKIVL